MPPPSFIDTIAFSLASPYALDADRARILILGIARVFEWEALMDGREIATKDDLRRSVAVSMIRVSLRNRNTTMLEDALKKGDWW